MKTTTLWVIRIALAVQFIGVLAVPSLVAASDAPRPNAHTLGILGFATASCGLLTVRANRPIAID